jgi:hypothetical protein
VPELDAGFRLLYQLKPAEARTQFAARQKTHPEDPLGSAADAASYLFEECYRQGILTSEFFLDDDRFLGTPVMKRRSHPSLSSAENGSQSRILFGTQCSSIAIRITPDTCRPQSSNQILTLS